MPKFIKNPILKGFNPDPSIARVGQDYYIATSTFEWFPGVQIHHSTDLANWSLVTRPLNRPSQLNMLGNPNSGGVWAPCLSWSDGLFYLAYSDIKRLEGNFKIGNNYLVTSKTIEGDWSDPVYLNSSGFDPSIFHDDDGRKWLLNMIWDHRPRRNSFYGISIQQFCPKDQRLVGEPRMIFKGSDLGCTEGPHMYKRDGYYYLMTAEGGTGFDHAVSLARSRNIFGPFEIAPNNPILTSVGHAEAALQRAGHGDIVETSEGETYLVHLCGRPIPNRGRCVMGRETAIQKMRWTEDDWLELDAGGNEPQVYVEGPDNIQSSNTRIFERDDFDSPNLLPSFQTLRVALDPRDINTSDRSGYLRMRGGRSICTPFEQSLIARRQQAFRFSATTMVDFDPRNFQQMAGLVYYYGARNYCYLYITLDEELGRVLDMAFAENSESYTSPVSPISIPEEGSVWLRADVDYDELRFSYSFDGYSWIGIQEKIDASVMSDECAGAHANFTGAFIGLCCQDISGRGHYADFDFFEYGERNEAKRPPVMEEAAGSRSSDS